MTTDDPGEERRRPDPLRAIQRELTDAEAGSPGVLRLLAHELNQERDRAARLDAEVQALREENRALAVTVAEVSALRDAALPKVLAIDVVVMFVSILLGWSTSTNPLAGWCAALGGIPLAALMIVKVAAWLGHPLDARRLAQEAAARATMLRRSP